MQSSLRRSRAVRTYRCNQQGVQSMRSHPLSLVLLKSDPSRVRTQTQSEFCKAEPAQPGSNVCHCDFLMNICTMQASELRKARAVITCRSNLQGIRSMGQIRLTSYGFSARYVTVDCRARGRKRAKQTYQRTVMAPRVGRSAAPYTTADHIILALLESDPSRVN